TPIDERQALEVRTQRPLGYVALARVLLGRYPARSVLSVTLMTSQSVLYNAIFFTYGLVLTHFYGVPAPAVPKFFFAFAAGNLLGDQQHPDPTRLFYGYLFAAVIMVQAGVVEALIGVKAERMPLEDIAAPLSAVGGAPKGIYE